MNPPATTLGATTLGAPFVPGTGYSQGGSSAQWEPTVAGGQPPAHAHAPSILTRGSTLPGATSPAAGEAGAPGALPRAGSWPKAASPAAAGGQPDLRASVRGGPAGRVGAAAGGGRGRGLTGSDADAAAESAAKLPAERRDPKRPGSDNAKVPWMPLGKGAAATQQQV